MNLYKHQQDILDVDPKKTGLFLGTGSGKTLTALLLARGKTLVICPKTQKEDRNWEREAQKNKIKLDLTVMSKEEFRSHAHGLKKFDTVIVDEAHTCLGATPNVRYVHKQAIPKTSQLFEELITYVNRQQPKRLYLVTATVIRSPMTVWAAAQLLGQDWNFYEFRDDFYIRLNIPRREIWVPKKTLDVKDRLAKAVCNLGFVGRLEDFFDVPDQTHRVDYVELSLKQKNRIKEMAFEHPEPIVRVGKIHQIENGVLAGDEFNESQEFDTAKIDKILDYGLEFPRMVIFAMYKQQIAVLEAALVKEGYNVFVLTGDTKNRGELIKQARESKEGIFIAQAQISAGWELPEYPVMIFASQNYSFVDYDQALGRIQRSNNIKKNLYITLLSKGGVDQAVYNCVKNKQDFNERVYLENNERGK